MVEFVLDQIIDRLESFMENFLLCQLGIIECDCDMSQEQMTKLVVKQFSNWDTFDCVFTVFSIKHVEKAASDTQSLLAR